MKTNLKCKVTAMILASILLLSMFGCAGCNKNIDEAARTDEDKITINNTTINDTVADSQETVATSELSDSDTTENEVSESEFVSKKVEIDYYKIPDIYSKIITDEELEFYNKFVTAWLNYEPMVEFDNVDVLTNCWSMVKECFFIAYGDLDVETGYDVGDNCVYLHYLTNSKEEHEEVIRQFEERVQFFFDNIDEKTEGLELAHQLYANFNDTLNYSYDVVENDSYSYANSSGYPAMMSGDGICMSYAIAYTYLLRQVGFEAFYVSSQIHAWGVIKVGDKYYFVDPTWDYVYEPDNYYYFCFGLDRREEDGFPEEEMILLSNSDYKMSDYVTIERGNYQDS